MGVGEAKEARICWAVYRRGYGDLWKGPLRASGRVLTFISMRRNHQGPGKDTPECSQLSWEQFLFSLTHMERPQKGITLVMELNQPETKSCAGLTLTNLKSESQKDPIDFKNKIQNYQKKYNKMQHPIMEIYLTYNKNNPRIHRNGKI